LVFDSASIPDPGVIRLLRVFALQSSRYLKEAKTAAAGLRESRHMILVFLGRY
jgi:hypothetical protein